MGFLVKAIMLGAAGLILLKAWAQTITASFYEESKGNTLLKLFTFLGVFPELSLRRLLKVQLLPVLRY